jgi:hypothetical protein
MTKRRGERPMVPPAEFSSYYGKPVLNPPTWRSPDIPGYLFLGGLAGASSLLAAGSDLTGRPALGRAAKTGAFAAVSVSLAALVHRRNRAVAALSGGALIAASAATRWGVFHAGMASARDPKYTVVPQRQRLDQRAASATAGAAAGLGGQAGG